jgi:hypothetical protein
MTRDYALAPFAPENKNLQEGRNETWTASTTLYSLDLHCEAPRLERGEPTRREADDEYVYKSIHDCKWPYLYLDELGNETIGFDGGMSIKEAYYIKRFSSFYVGYYSTDYSDWYLKGLCAETANHTW